MNHLYILYIYILSFFKTYETFPVEIVRAQAREHLTHARARCASTDRRARETREQIEARARGARARPRCERVFARASVRHARAQISSPKVDLVSLFAIWRAYLRARVSDGALLARLARARLYLLARLARARLSLLAHLARARVKCSRARAAHPAAGEAPYMNSYVLNQANIYIYIYISTPTLESLQLSLSELETLPVIPSAGFTLSQPLFQAMVLAKICGHVRTPGYLWTPCNTSIFLAG